MKILRYEDTTNIIVVAALASFPHVVQPRLNTADPKPENHFLEYSIEVLIDKDTDLTIFNQVLDEVKIARWKSLAKVPNFRYGPPLKDGDQKFNRDGAPYDGYPGRWFITARASENRKPLVIDLADSELTQLDAIVGGDIVNVFCSVYSYSTAGNHGIGFGLNSVQLRKKADMPLGGGVARTAVRSALAGVNDDLDDFAV